MSTVTLVLSGHEYIVSGAGRGRMSAILTILGVWFLLSLASGFLVAWAGYRVNKARGRI